MLSKLVGICAVLLPIAVAAQGGPFPDRAVRMVVGYSPGGGSDQVARPLAQALSAKWGQPVVVDNKPGGSGMIGAGSVASSPPDGYTLLLAANNEVALNVALFSKMPYDPLTNLMPVSLVAETPMLLVADPALEIKDVRAFVTYAAARPRTLNYASGGIGTAQHFAGELLNMRAKLEMVHIPYKSGGPQIAALLGKEVQVGFTALLPAIPFVRNGRLQALAISSSSRSSSLPTVPTVDESGYPGFEVVQWYSAWAPAGTPPEIVQRIAADIQQIVQSPEYAANAAAQGLRVVGSTSDELRKKQISEIAKYKEIATRANIKAN